MAPRTAITDPAVAAVFDDLSRPLRTALLDLREIVLSTAQEAVETRGVVETLKWGDPAYVPVAPRVGTTVRINAVRGETGAYAAFFHCQTSLVSSFRSVFPTEFEYRDNRAIILRVGAKPAIKPLRRCIALALTYHARARGRGGSG